MYCIFCQNSKGDEYEVLFFSEWICCNRSIIYFPVYISTFSDFFRNQSTVNKTMDGSQWIAPRRKPAYCPKPHTFFVQLSLEVKVLLFQDSCLLINISHCHCILFSKTKYSTIFILSLTCSSLDIARKA